MFVKRTLVQLILTNLLFLTTFVHGSKINPVLLVSFDGLRASSLDEFVIENPSSNFKKLIDNGVKAEYMLPSFPSITFPSL